MSLIIRYDHNVPVHSDGSVADWTRVDQSVSELSRLVADGEAVTVVSHWGYPGGRVTADRSTARLADRLRDDGIPVVHAVWPGEGDRPAPPCPGQVLYLENLRFDPREEANDLGFAAELAEYGDRYLLGSLSVAHRRHASVAELPRLLSESDVGEVVRHQLEALDALQAAGPIGLIIGGAKVRSKLGAAAGLVNRAAFVALTGRCGEVAAMTEGNGDLPGDDERAAAHRMLEVARASGTPIIASSEISKVVCGVEGAVAKGVNALLWCGPLGVYEQQKAMAETASLARLMRRLIADGGRALAAGGDTLASVLAASPGVDPDLPWISAGGAALAYLSRGWDLPGLAPLAPAATEVHHV